MPDLMVRYANGQARARRVQSTVYPTPQQLGCVTCYEMWRMHVIYHTDRLYGTNRRWQEFTVMEELLDEVREMLDEDANE
jgi:hypothetical protein